MRRIVTDEERGSGAKSARPAGVARRAMTAIRIDRKAL
jgi:hypothetical protein